MKKILALILALIMLVSLVACGAENTTDPKNTENTNTSEITKPEGYPKGAITAICPYAAGGNTDLSLRTLLTAWEPFLGGSFVVSNVTGGSGTVAATQMVTEKTDGYVIGVLSLGNMVTSTFSIDVTYDLDDFDFIGAYVCQTYGMLVNPDSQYQTFDDLVNAAKAAPIKVVCASTTEQIAVKKLNKALGTQFEDIYYNATSDAITDLLGGRIEALLGCETSVASYLKAGQMKLLASLSATRFNNAPDVPTIGEMGHPECETASYYGIGVPKGVDPEILDYLRATFMEAVNTEAFAKDVVEKCNAVASPMTYQEYYDLLVAQREEQGPLLTEMAAG